jgi:hypothetical protein
VQSEFNAALASAGICPSARRQRSLRSTRFEPGPWPLTLMRLVHTGIPQNLRDGQRVGMGPLPAALAARRVRSAAGPRPVGHPLAVCRSQEQEVAALAAAPGVVAVADETSGSLAGTWIGSRNAGGQTLTGLA